MSLVADLKRFKRERMQELPTRIVAETVREFSDRLVRIAPAGVAILFELQLRG